MASTDIYLRIMSPEASIAGRMVGKVTLPGVGGRFTVLSGHAPLIASLGEGDIVYSAGEETVSLHIRSGFAEVSDNAVSVCVEV